MNIVSLGEEHLAQAASLMSKRYRLLRQRFPLLPTRYEDSEGWLARLAELISSAPGVAAVDEGRLAGYHTGWLIPSLRGQRSTYSPEWANGVDPEYDAGHVYQEMYTALSARWVAVGHCDHYVSLLAHDQRAISGWQWLGFGHYVIDALRDLAPIGAIPADVEIRRATPDDLQIAVALQAALRRHLASAPTFLRWDAEPSSDDLRAWLGSEANALWLAYRDGEALACLGLGPASEDACTIIRDSGTTSIISAFTAQTARGDGVASGLLERALAWARDHGYVRCCVDFEAANVLATRFWLRHFEPVCWSLYRHVNPPPTA